MTVAAVDCGTNSTRLLVLDDDRVVERRAEITRLGGSVDATGLLDVDGVGRTLAVLREFRASMDEHGAERVRAAATSAVRDARNRGDFLDAAEVVLGTRPDVLTGHEEASLAFEGATSGIDATLGPFLVVDIGGGSTEFAFGTDAVAASISVDIGCVRLTEQFLHHDPPAPAELSACISVVEEYLADVGRAIPDLGETTTLVGLAGTIRTVAAVEVGCDATRDAIHHFRLSHEAVEDVFRTLATEPLADRIHNPGLPEARADVIVAGCCVLVATLRRFGFDEVLVSEDDILDGLARSLRS